MEGGKGLVRKKWKKAQIYTNSEKKAQFVPTTKRDFVDLFK